MAGSERCGVHEQISDQFIGAMDEVTREHRCPWHSSGGHLHLPRNIAFGRAYQGINILALWAAGIVHGYDSGTVGTRRQWAEAGFQVLKDEKPTTIVCYRGRGPDPLPPFDAGGVRHEARSHLAATASRVFFVEQTDAYTPVFLDDPPCETEIIAAGEAYMAASGACFLFGGSRAFYDPESDAIRLPYRGAFRGTKTSSRVQSFYATALHELGHWSGAKGRLRRSAGRRFGGDADAAGALVAELFAAFKCAELGVANELRPDHRRYVHQWRSLMKADSRALFGAAAAASRAVRYVDALQLARPGAAAAEPSGAPEPG